MKKAWLVLVLLIMVLLCGCEKGNSDNTTNTTNPTTSNNSSNNMMNRENTLRTFIVNSPVKDKEQANVYTDTILIYEPLKQVKPVVIINTAITQDMRNSYNLIGDRFFFFNKKDMMIEWLDFDGGIHKIPSTKGDYNECTFVVSVGENKIAWISIEDGEKIKSTLYVSDLDGNGKKELYQMESEYEILKVVKWSNSGDDLFFAKSMTGLGGLVVYRNYEDIYRININNGQMKSIVSDIEPTRDISDNTDYISDLSPNEELIAYFNQINGHFKIFVRNINTLKEDVYDVPDGENYLAAGNAFFSADSKSIYYEVDYQDPELSLEDGEYDKKFVIIDFDKKTSRVYNETDFPYIIIDNHWLDKSNQTLTDSLEDMKQYNSLKN